MCVAVLAKCHCKILPPSCNLTVKFVALTVEKQLAVVTTSVQEQPDAPALLESFTDPAALLDLDYGIQIANRAYRDLYTDGHPLQQRRCYEVSHDFNVPCDQAGESCPIHASLETGEPQRKLHVHHTPHGEELVDVETRPLRDGEGRITSFLEIHRPTRVTTPQAQRNRLVGRSPAFRQMLELLQRVAPSDTTVLLLGESGTGKDVLAQEIHKASGRAGKPLVPVECSGLTETLFESELFGHKKGAFTGAVSSKIGLVEAAEGGTLFLDEIGDVPLGLQVKLLRLLETRMYRRVGCVESLHADFRLICATNQDFKVMLSEGTFRQDLYYRISTFPIPLPPLRERIEDLPSLIDTLLRHIQPHRHLSLSANALACLKAYWFPGNIRELQNILERAALLSDGDSILPEHLPEEVVEAHGRGARGLDDLEEEVLPLQVVEERYLRGVLARSSDDRINLARKLGISERTLYRKTKALRIR
jgi:two-component system, NtrC family, response regulator HydG